MYPAVEGAYKPSCSEQEAVPECTVISASPSPTWALQRDSVFASVSDIRGGII